MSSDDFALVRGLFGEAIDMEPGDREALLRRPGVPEDIAIEVRRLLASHERSCNLLDRGLPQQTAHDAPQIGSYRVIRELGRGGMGIVYLAMREDDAFERAVAIKVIRKDPPGVDAEARFRQERRILAALDHPNIARVLDAGTTADQQLYCVMEFIDGRPIDQYCEATQASVNKRLELFLQLCDAVHYLHGNRVIHRDIKPGNVLVTAEGTAKLVDFGIAKLRSLGNLSHTMQVTGGPLMMMTPRYASPEQLRGEAIAESSDVYSLGVVLYGLLTGNHPYKDLPEEPSRAGEMLQRSRPLVPSGNICPDLKVREGTAQVRRRLLGDLDKIVLRAIHPQVNSRYASAQELSDDVHRYLQGEPVKAQAQTVSYRAVKFLQRHRRAAAVCCAMFVLAGLGTWQTVNATFERERIAAREADLDKVVETLGSRFPRWNALSVAEQTQELGRLCDALRAAAGRQVRSDHHSVGKQVMNLLDQTRGSRDPDVRYRAALAWKLLGDFQAKAAPLGEAHRSEAIQSYRESHRSLQEVAKLQPDPAEALRAAADVEGRLKALGERLQPTPKPPTIVRRKDERTASRDRQIAVAADSHLQGTAEVAATAAVPEADWLALKSRYREVAGRVAGARSSAKTLAESLRARGFGINGDLAALLESMNLAMEHADTAIERNNYVEAREAIDSAGAYADRALRHFGR